jgi:23S rRNA pseudouridine2605 synthase
MNASDSGAPDLPAAEADKIAEPAPTPTLPPAPPGLNDEGEGDDPFDEDDDEPDEHDAARAAARAAPPPAPIRFEDVVSGQFDADEARPEVQLDKRVLSPQADTPKLHKVLAQTGLGSRMEMEQLIVQGRISVNNEPAHIGQRIQFGDQIKINGKPIRFRIAPPPPRVIAYHKPVGEVVTHDDPQNRPTVFRKLPKLHQGKWQSVGRLDLNTEGLLLFTSSGELANKLMHPRFGLEREYAVRVLGALSAEEKQRLLDGIDLEDGRAQFGSVEEGGGEGANTWYRVTISEGRNREVRRLFEAMGHAVSRLIRIRYGAMVLPRGLKRGAWMELDDRDIGALAQAAGAERSGGGVREGQRLDEGNRRRGNRTGGPRGNNAGGRAHAASKPRGARHRGADRRGGLVMGRLRHPAGRARAAKDKVNSGGAGEPVTARSARAALRAPSPTR